MLACTLTRGVRRVARLALFAAALPSRRPAGQVFRLAGRLL